MQSSPSSIESLSAQVSERPRLVLIGADAALAATIRRAMELHQQLPELSLLVLLGSDANFPFRARPTTLMLDGVPDHVIACAPMLEQWQIASRLASTLGLPGCHDGDVVELAGLWLDSLQPAARAQVQLAVQESAELLPALQALARRYDLPLIQLPAFA